MRRVARLVALAFLLPAGALAQTNWGLETVYGLDGGIGSAQAQGGTSPSDSGMVLQSITFYLGGYGNTENFRVALYQGGSLSTGPDGATLLEDLGQIGAGGLRNQWVTLNSSTNPSISASSVIWIGLKANGGGTSVKYTNNSAQREDFDSGGRYQSSVISTNESVGWPDPWPSDSGSFGSIWYCAYLTYTVAGGATPKMMLLGVGP